MKKLILLLFFLQLFINCAGQDCEKISKNYNSYSEVESVINQTSFNFADDVDTSKSSWIRTANYYSCDNKKGFLVIETKTKKYIFKEVPIRIWNEFKKASSFGKYYNQFIRNRYHLYLN